jgi:hypothetical protein
MMRVVARDVYSNVHHPDPKNRAQLRRGQEGFAGLPTRHGNCPVAPFYRDSLTPLFGTWEASRRSASTEVPDCYSADTDLIANFDYAFS